MPMHFEELDSITRGYMLEEFDAEQRGPTPYRSKNMSAVGREAFPNLMRSSITVGSEETLIVTLKSPLFWNPIQTLADGTRRRLNVNQAAESFGRTEYSTTYTRGLTKRFLVEGVERCQIYRAAPPKWESAECSSFEGQIFPVKLLFDGHRARYWPEPGNPDALSIPFTVGCHHSIRRV